MQQQTSPKIILWIIAIVQFLTPFMLSALGIALPSIGLEFSAAGADLGLINMAYILANAMLLLPIGRFADIYGRKKIFLSGIIVMTLATAALGFSNSVTALISFRFIQGIGGAMITSTSFAILTSVFPPEKRGQAMGIVVSGVYLGVSLGPTLAGVVVEHLGWRWIFYCAIPIQLFIMAVAFTFMKGEWADAKGKKFDLLGSVLYMMGLSGIILGSLGHTQVPGGSYLLFLGIASIVSFLIFETRVSFPILPLAKIIKNRVFALSNIASFLNYAASFSVTFFFSLYLQIIKGFSPQTAGFILVVQPLIQAVIAPQAGKLSDRFSPAPIATVGMTLCTIGIIGAATIDEHTTLPMIYGILVFMGLGFGTFSTPNSAAIMASVERVDFGMASSMLATMRTVGMLVAMTITTGLLAHYLGEQEISLQTMSEFLQTMKTAMFIFTFAGVLAIFCSMGRFVRKP